MPRKKWHPECRRSVAGVQISLVSTLRIRHKRLIRFRKWDEKEHLPIDVLRKGAELGFGEWACRVS